jgi:hypothetical protein
MNKYLIKETGPCGYDYYSFESDKNKEQVIEEFNSIYNSLEPRNTFSFHNVKNVYRGEWNNYKIITLDEFWESYR